MKKASNDKKTTAHNPLRMPQMYTKHKQVRAGIKARASVARRTYSIVDVHDWRVAAGIGMILGMLIVGLPSLIGVTILISIVAISLKLVGEGRL